MMKKLILNEENPARFLDGVMKYEKKLLKAEDPNAYVDEMMEIIEQNRVGLHNGILMGFILRNMDFDSFSYYRSRELYDKLIRRYYGENSHKSERYWIVRMASKLAQKEAYDFLIDVIKSEEALNVRANAMKSLAMVSGQPFDRSLPKDPGKWKETDIRMKELERWVSEGRPDGEGYPPPVLDEALFHPTTDFEVTVSKLNAKLSATQDRLDFSSYDNYLTVTDEETWKRLIQVYRITGIYAEFLKRFSPCHVVVTKGMNEILLYGVDDLANNQVGYGVDRDGNSLEGWPKNYLVIADRFGDPYCIDVTKEDSKVFFAAHGEGNWKFKKAYNSFADFLDYLAK
ncbi:MAG: SMI1/KNR4 family protein [Clostridia bacterium]|nr:SMI1/KNR4 family protein [Clostridia bacterium]